MSGAPLILWFRRDLRLGDQPMLAAAAATDRPLIPVFLLDPRPRRWVLRRNGGWGWGSATLPKRLPPGAAG